MEKTITIKKGKNIIQINKDQVIATRLVEEEFYHAFNIFRVEIETTTTTYKIMVNKEKILKDFKINFHSRTNDSIRKEIETDQGICEYLEDIKCHNYEYFYQIIMFNRNEDIVLNDDDIVSYNVNI